VTHQRPGLIERLRARGLKGAVASAYRRLGNTTTGKWRNMANQKIDLSNLSPDYQRFVADLFVRKRVDLASFCTEISPNDEMFFKAILPGYGNEPNVSYFKYVESALRIFDVYRQLVDGFLGGFAHVGSVLDFGSGYGRLTRSLLQHLPRERIWVSDIYAGAMAWQAQTLGVNALMSVKDPDRFALDKSFSVVFAGSVFSHLPDALFQRWLNRLYRLVAPDGILVFSVHGAPLLPQGEQMTPEGLRYLEHSESDSLGADVYGMTYVTEAYVDASIARLDPSRQVQFRRFNKGLYENQDLYVIGGAQRDLPDLSLRISPIGGFEGATEGAGGDLGFAGWAIDLNRGHQIARFEVYCDDERIHVGEPIADLARVLAYFPGAPNVPVRWSFTLPARLRRPHAVIRVELHSSSGAVAYAYATPPTPEALRSGRLQAIAT
jgi:SAM-dependent methyltransferase